MAMVTLKQLLDDVVVKGASDLHIGVEMPPAMRISGALDSVPGLDPMTFEQTKAAFLEVISEAQYDRFASVGELDFSFAHTTQDGKVVRFRGNCYREMNGMSAAFRLIPMNIPSLEDLNVPPKLRDISKSRRGLFLVTGPTGHGKSTTLAAVINEINITRHEHIITIEDPIEFVHKPKLCVIHQREVGSHTASFAEALKRALREDPDVLLIGELRDLETIRAAVTAAETGHFVLGTLHTQDAPQSIDRIIDVFPPEQQQQIRVQLASGLVGICSQQLLPKNGGGRACATELLVANSAVRNNIREGKTNQIRTLIQTGKEQGMHTMEQCLADFVRLGTVTKETAMTFAYQPAELERSLVSGL